MGGGVRCRDQPIARAVAPVAPRARVAGTRMAGRRAADRQERGSRRAPVESRSGRERHRAQRVRRRAALEETVMNSDVAQVFRLHSPALFASIGETRRSATGAKAVRPARSAGLAGLKSCATY